jgi:hypothetical protein
MTPMTISAGEIDSFAHRLEGFAATLTPAEQSFLYMLLMRAGRNDGDDVEAHRLARASIAPLVLAAATIVGAANANANPVQPSAAMVTHVHHVISVVGDDKGGAETITYTVPER